LGGGTYPSFTVFNKIFLIKNFFLMDIEDEP
jgi:hypothetical protein